MVALNSDFTAGFFVAGFMVLSVFFIFGIGVEFKRWVNREHMDR
jgi:hypothetical protein